MRKRAIRGRVALCLMVCALGSTVAADGEEASFPYALTRADLVVLPAAYGSGMLGAYLQDHQTLMEPADVLSLDGQSVNWLDRSATKRWSVRWDDASDIVGQVQAHAPWILVATQARRREWGNVATFAVMYYETYLLTKGLTKVTQHSVDRTRPYLYNTGLGDETRVELSRDPGAHGSFFSGHTSGSFAAAVFFAQVHQDTHPGSRANRWVWGVCLAAASVSGTARYMSGWHYPTDVIGGAIVGSAIGYLVPALHRSGQGTVSVGPAGPGGVSLTVRF